MAKKVWKYTKKMKLQCFDAEAGIMIAIMHSQDTKELGIFPTERVEIRNPATGRSISAVVDVTDTMVKGAEIGVFKDVSKYLRARCNQMVEVRAVEKPKTVSYIRKKLEGRKLSSEEISEIINDIATNRLSDIEISALMSAIYIYGFDLNETVAMTKALIKNGKKLKINKQVVVDKHSIGGTNGRVTMVLVPIVAVAGCYIPKTSSRSITSSSGTADAMEVLTNVSLSLNQIKKITEKIGGVIVWGGAVELAPADDKIIKIEHPLSLDPPGQVIASVLAKKASVGAKYVVIDLPIGPKVKIKTTEQAEEMAGNFIAVGKELGVDVEVVLTDGTEPCGRAFGPALEAKYVMKTLEGKEFDDLAVKSCELAGILLELVGKADKGEGRIKAEQILRSGRALNKMQEIIKAQGGNITSSEQIKLAKFKKLVRAKKSGEISNVDVRLVNTIARLAGAPADKKAGVMLLAESGDKIKKDQPLMEIYAENRRKLELAERFVHANYPFTLERLVLGRYG